MLIVAMVFFASPLLIGPFWTWEVMASLSVIQGNLASFPINRISFALFLSMTYSNTSLKTPQNQIVMSRFKRRRKKSKPTRPHTQVFSVGGKHL